VEDHRRFIGVLEKKLADNIEDDGESDEGSQSKSNLLAQGKFLVLLRERVAREFLEDTHGWVYQGEKMRCFDAVLSRTEVKVKKENRTNIVLSARMHKKSQWRVCRKEETDRKIKG
jgi:hypothetical protein